MNLGAGGQLSYQLSIRSHSLSVQWKSCRTHDIIEIGGLIDSCPELCLDLLRRELLLLKNFEAFAHNPFVLLLGIREQGMILIEIPEQSLIISHWIYFVIIQSIFMTKQLAKFLIVVFDLAAHLVE